MTKFKIPSLFFLAFLAALFISPVATDSTGSSLWDPPVDNETNTYARVIELQHAGDKNGRLLATWEHTYTAGPGKTPNGTAGDFIIRESRNGGKSWTTLATVHDNQTNHYTRFFQPFLFELPHKMGDYPEGTLLLVGNLLPSNSSTTNFFTWRSTDHGETWKAVGTWQRGGPSRSGIWEPFLYTDNKGKLVAVFSDERQSKMHSQMLATVTSEDGGDTWSGFQKVVASSNTKDRPGMATVAKMGNGEYIMSYEVCGHKNCPVRTKTSSDGVSWEPKDDIGTSVHTTDGLYLGSAPYTAWDSSTKQVVLASHFVYFTNDTEAPASHRAVLINKNNGKGDWSWAPSPWTVPKDLKHCMSNYSPALLPRSNGVVRYTAPASQESGSGCSERTGEAPIGVLPYTANFSTSGQAGWIDFGGKWSISEDEYGFEPVESKPAVAVTGSTGWTDYKIAGDVMITGSSGSVGLNLRMSSSGMGPTQLKGYTVAIDTASGNLTTYQHGNSTTVLRSKAHPGAIEGKKWYHLSVAVKSKELTTTLAEEKNGTKTSYTVTDDTFEHGMAGLFGKNGGGSFKNVKITN